MPDIELGKRILALRERIVAKFGIEDWEAIGLLTGLSGVITGHPRLLRSLHWGDEDYSGNVLTVLRNIAENDEGAFSVVEQYVFETYPGESRYVSARPSAKTVTFAPSVFQLPDADVENDLVAVMMPFRAEFSAVYDGIVAACREAGFRCLRVDDMWEESTIIQDIFNLIFRAQVVIVDFTGKNPNVMYETGIAHTLGKHVVPISQSIEDVPFDMAHHRILRYLSNAEGLSAMIAKLSDKLRQVSK